MIYSESGVTVEAHSGIYRIDVYIHDFHYEFFNMMYQNTNSVNKYPLFGYMIANYLKQYNYQRPDGKFSNCIYTEYDVLKSVTRRIAEAYTYLDDAHNQTELMLTRSDIKSACNF